MREALTRAELMALPAVVGLDTASRALGMGRDKGQRLARADEFPVRLLRIGRRYRVSTVDLLTYLGLPIPEQQDGGAA